MAKKPISQKRAERQQQENAALQKVLNVFLLGIAAECWLLLVYRNYDMGGVNSMLTWHEILKVCMYAGLVLLAGGIGGIVFLHRLCRPLGKPMVGPGRKQRKHGKHGDAQHHKHSQNADAAGPHARTGGGRPEFLVFGHRGTSFQGL